MKNTAVAPAPGPDLEALIKEARRRQRRRYAATGVALAAVLAAAIGALAGLPGASGPRRPSHPRPAAGHSARPQVPGPIPANVGTTVLMWPAGRRSGRHDRRRQPAHRAARAGHCGGRPGRVSAGHGDRRLDRLRPEQERPGHQRGHRQDAGAREGPGVCSLRQAWRRLARAGRRAGRRGRRQDPVRPGVRRAARAADHPADRPARRNSADRRNGRRPAAGAAR